MPPKMFDKICAEINWSPIANIFDDSNKMKLVDDKKGLLAEIIECRRLGHFDISLKLAERGLLYYPNDPVLLDNIARLYWKFNRYSDAINLWKQVLASKKASSRLKNSALNFILNDHIAFSDFIYDNVCISTPMNHILKTLIDLSIERRKEKDLQDSFQYIKNAWADSFLHPALVDNFARIQYSLGSRFKSLYCFKLLSENAVNDKFKESAVMFLQQNESDYFAKLSQDIQKICTEFDQLLPSNLTSIDSFTDFVNLRIELGRQILPDTKVSLFNIAFFRYIDHNEITLGCSYQIYFDACLNLNYINEAQNFYDKYKHYFDVANQTRAEAKLSHLKTVSFPSYMGSLNNELAELANAEDVDYSLFDISEVETYSNLEKKSIELMEKFITINPRLTLKLFDCFAKIGFLTPLLFKYRGIAFTKLGLKNDGIMALKEYILITDGSIDLIDLSLPCSNEINLVVTTDLKNNIYKNIDSKNYQNAANELAEFILRRSFFSGLYNSELISLTFDHKTFIDNTKDPTQRDLKDLYAEISFYDKLIEVAENISG